MAQLYRMHKPGGVIIEATGQLIYPGDSEWPAYEAWLADQPGPTMPGGPVPPGTGLLPFMEPALPLAQMRAEAHARLDGLVASRRNAGNVNAAGHAWALSWPFVLAVLTHRAAFPPVPAGFTLPNAARVQVALNNVQLSQLVEAMSARLILVNDNYAALTAAIDASAAPLTVDLTAGWP